MDADAAPDAAGAADAADVIGDDDAAAASFIAAAEARAAAAAALPPRVAAAPPRRVALKSAHVVPVLLAAADGSAPPYVLLGFRRCGPAAGTWTEAATTLDHHYQSPSQAAPCAAAARAAHGAYMGLLGSTVELERALGGARRVALGDGGIAFVLPVAAADVDAHYNAVARHIASAFVADRGREHAGALVGCPDALAPFTRVRWVSLPALQARLDACVRPRGAPATRGGGAAAASAAASAALPPLPLPPLSPPRSAARLDLAPRTVAVLRFVLPALAAWSME